MSRAADIARSLAGWAETATRAPRALSTVSFLVAVVALAGLWLEAQSRIFDALPPTQRLAAVEIPGDVDQITIGRRELGQRAGPQSAEATHLRLTRTPEGGWAASNVAEARKALLLYPDGSSRYLRRWPVRQGDRIALDGVEFTVSALTPRRQLTLDASDGRRIRIDLSAGRAQIEGSTRALSDVECGIAQGPLGTARDALRRWSATERKLVDLGGGVDCADRIATGGAPGGAAITLQDGEALLAPGRGGSGPRMRRDGETAWRSLAQTETTLLGGPRDPSAIILGRTRYALDAAAGGGLRLTPVENAHLFFDLDESCPQTAGGGAAGTDPRGLCRLAALRADADPRVRTVLIRAEAPTPAAPARGAVLWAGALGVAAALLALRFGGRAAQRRQRPVRLHKAPAAPTALLLGAAIGVLALFLGARDAAPAPTLGAMAIAQWAIASLALVWAPERSARLYLFWLAMSVVIGIGALTLAQLSHGTADARWLRFDGRHQLSLMLTLTAVAIVASLDLEAPRALIRAAVHGESAAAVWLRAAPLAALAALFAAWIALGREEGLGDFQPVEAGKLAAVLILAVLSTRLHHARLFAAALARRAALIATVAGAVLFYALLFGVAPALRGDYSPILILACVGAVLTAIAGGMLRVHRLSQIRLKRRARPPGEPAYPLLRWRRPWLETVALFGAIAGLGGAAALGASEIGRVGAALATPAAADFGVAQERIAVYLRPALHPDLGAQLLQSLGLIAETPCYPWERGLIPGCAAALGALGPNPEAATRLPAVQDDFILAFLIHRFGIGAAALLAAAQILAVWLTVDAALRKYRWSGGDYADDAARQVLCFTGFGAALMLSAHWLIAWANAFGAIPVMGQPMSWVSAGNSHILFMAAPFLLMSLLLLRWPTRRAAPAPERAPPPPDIAATAVGVAEAIWPGSRLARAIATMRDRLRAVARIGSKTESGRRADGRAAFGAVGDGPAQWRGGDPQRRR